MITKNDCLLLLDELSEEGIDVGSMQQLALNYNGVNVQVVKFINSHRPFEANRFYEKLRKSYNEKHSILYKNIVREDVTDVNEVLTTLASLNLQILLFAKGVKDRDFFLNQVRFKEICKVLEQYSRNYDLVPCIRLLKIIRADLKAFEYFNKSE